MKKIAFIFALCLTVALQGRAQGLIEPDRTVWDFGDILTTQGPVHCEYHIKNVSSKPLTILNVVSSCGCTDVSWSKASFAPGESATVSATYKNDAGPYPFDKTLTVYVSDVKQPLVLHLRGTAHEKQKPLGELYPIHSGSLGLKDTLIVGGTMSQGQTKSGEVRIANLGKKAMTLTFKDADPGLKVEAPMAPVEAGQTAPLRFSVTPDRNKWGSSIFRVTPVVNGVPSREKISVKVVIKEDFSSLSREQRAAGSNPVFETGTFAFGRARKGEKIKVRYECRNAGKSPFVVHKADCDSPAVTMKPFATLAPGKTAALEGELDTSSLPSGEALIIVSLTTNSPLRPIVNLFISGYIE